MKFVTPVFLLCILVGIPIKVTNSSYDASWTIGEWLVSYWFMKRFVRSNMDDINYSILIAIFINTNRANGINI